MKKTRFLFPWLLLGNIALVSTSRADETNWYAKGLQTEYAGDYQTAIMYYTKSANTGLSDASFAIGRLHRALGDYKASLEWLLKAANAGNKFAQYEVGLVYSYGNSTTLLNRNEAIKWFTYAASSHQGEAAYELFKLIEEMKWLEVAAEQGIQGAMQDISEAYAKGLYGAEISMDKSEYWAQRSIESQEKGEGQ